MNAISYGYVRVSTREQNETRQVIAMQAFGVAPEHIYIEKQSGKDFNRPQYKRLMRKMKQGDVLVIKSIDRLGRNYDEIIEQWRLITKRKGAAIVVLDMPLLDTRQGRDLTGTLIADIVLQLLSYVAQTEREFIRQRQAEGIAAARARGVHFGPRPMERPEQYECCRAEWLSGSISAREAARRMQISHKTFLKWVKEDEGERGAQDTSLGVNK
jgi:DNA invertase Pin-like site-specific DNA recombinase